MIYRVFICCIILQSLWDAIAVDRFVEDDHRIPSHFRDNTQKPSANLLAVPPRIKCVRETEICRKIPASVRTYLESIGVQPTHNYTSTERNDTEIIDIIKSVERLRFHSGCWHFAQPVLLALVLPKCVGSEHRLIPSKLCRDFEAFCGNVVIRTLPPPLNSLANCEDERSFSRSTECETQISWLTPLRTNISSACPVPTVRTLKTWKFIDLFEMPLNDQESKKVDHVIAEGCGFQCRNPYYTENQQRNLHIYVAIMVSLSLIFNSTAFISLALRWKTLRKYPETCLLYINVCFLMADIGWLIQFFPGARELVACAEDGTTRIREPQPDESYALCLVTFVLVYYFIFAAAIWFVSMTYCWYRSFQCLYDNEVKAKGFLTNYSWKFHLLAWLAPLLMTSIAIETSGIDGNIISGICFIGIEWKLVRGFLVIMPLVIVALVSGYFVIRGLCVLYRLKHDKHENLSCDDKRTIRSTMLHIGSIATLICICILISVIIHAHYYIHEAHYLELDKEFLNCHLKAAIAGNETTHCYPGKSIDFETIQLGFHLGLQFVAGIIFSTWVFRRSPVKHWAANATRKITVEVREFRKRISTVTTPNRASGETNQAFTPDEPAASASAQSAPVATGSSNPESQSETIMMTPMIPEEPGSPEEVPAENSLANWASRALEARREAARKSSSALFSRNLSRVDLNENLNTIAVSIHDLDKTDLESGEQKLNNWHDKVREVRREMRKKSSVVNVPGGTRRAISVVDVIDMAVERQKMDRQQSEGGQRSPPPATRQRRYGRVENFGKGFASQPEFNPSSDFPSGQPTVGENNDAGKTENEQKATSSV